MKLGTRTFSPGTAPKNAAEAAALLRDALRGNRYYAQARAVGGGVSVCVCAVVMALRLLGLPFEAAAGEGLQRAAE